MDQVRTIITSEHVIYSFTPDMEPRWRVIPGERVEIRSRDGLGGTIRTEEDRVQVVDPAKVNAAVGPIFVEGAEAGDRLVFDIEDIQVPQDWGYILIIPTFGLLQGATKAARTKIVRIQDGHVWFNDMRIPLDPCIGTIGVAPVADAYGTMIPHDHGGNMDTTAIRAGARVHFPVNHAGALFAMGDPKAVMGDGEVCGTGVGAPINVFGHFELVKGGRLPRPVIETARDWQMVASAETLEEACRMATSDAISILERVKGMSWEEAYMLVSLVGDLKISQVVDPLMTVRLSMPKAYLETLDGAR